MPKLARILGKHHSIDVRVEKLNSVTRESENALIIAEGVISDFDITFYKSDEALRCEQEKTRVVITLEGFKGIRFISY